MNYCVQQIGCSCNGLGYSKKSPMVQHYFSEKQTAAYKENNFQATLRKYRITFTTAPGVFSLKKVDSGSLVLIEKCIISEKTKTILDLGCGYGPVGISIAKSFPEKHITMSDINQRAIKLARKNSKKNNIENVTLLHSDGFMKIKESFDVILLNPPQTAGKKICYKLIEDSHAHLTKKGTLQLVARHQKGGKQLANHMQEVFGNVKDIAKSSGYRVYLSERE